MTGPDGAIKRMSALPKPADIQAWQPAAPSAPVDPDALPIDDPEALAIVDSNLAADGIANGTETIATPPPTVAQPRVVAAPLFPLFLAFWFIGALVAFSWAASVSLTSP